MIEKTVFTNNDIVNIIRKNYNIEIKEIFKINRGSANIFLLNNKYILKEFQSKYSENDINKEIKIIEHLRKDGISVPNYISTIDGKFSFIYKNKVVVLQKYIDGYTMDKNMGNYNQMIESAKELGKIVKSLETLNINLSDKDYKSWYSISNLKESIDKYKNLIKQVEGPYKEKIILDLNDKIKMIQEIIKGIDIKDMDKITIKNTHGDYSVLQFIYKDEKIKAIIDFVSASKIPIIWELIRSFTYIDQDCKDGIINVNHLIDYIKEFNKYVKLNNYDIKYMSTLYLLQLLNSTYGYRQYISDNSKIDLLTFAIYRTNLCRNLFKNNKLITKTLQESIN